jgi:sugar/nucleoside kinase (ribokinase family)
LKRLIEQAAITMIDWKPKIGVVIRSGALGVCVAHLIQDQPNVTWIPAYYQPIFTTSKGISMNPSIVDVTGGGNAFLGGLSAGLQICKGDLIQAALFGSVGASYAIEQDGLPRLTMENGEERWNGSSSMDRVNELAARCGIDIAAL